MRLSANDSVIAWLPTRPSGEDSGISELPTGLSANDF